MRIAFREFLGVGKATHPKPLPYLGGVPCDMSVSHNAHRTYYTRKPFYVQWSLCIMQIMGSRMQKVAVCDVCGHVWIPSVEHPKLCASKQCRSTLWDKGGVDGRTREAKSKGKRGQRTLKQ